MKTIRAMEEAVIPIDCESQLFKLLCILYEEDKPKLLWRKRLSRIYLKWDELFSMNCESKINLDDLLDESDDIFKTELGKLKN